MKTSCREKYLGDIVSDNGKQNANIVERISKGNGIYANILVLMKDIPLGKRRFEVGIELRNAWFVNSILYNSESWQRLRKSD